MKTNQINIEAVFIPTRGSEEELVEAAYVAALKDPSPEGLLLLQLAKQKLDSIPSLRTLSSDVIERVQRRNLFVREGRLEVIEKWVCQFGGIIHNHIRKIVEQVQHAGGIPIIIANERIDLGVVYLKKIPT